VDPLRLYVVFDPAFAAGHEAWRLFAQAFGCLGMNRDATRFGVPVHARFAPWGAEQAGLPGAQQPRRIDLQQAASNVVLLLVDPVMSGFREAPWAAYVADLRKQMGARAGQDLLVPVLLSSRIPSFVQEQGIRPADARLPADERGQTRLLVQLLNAILVQRHPHMPQSAHQPGHGIFVSHAKRDGLDTAKRIVETIGKVNEGLGPRCFFDADSLLPGDDYPQRFERAIGAGSLLAIVTDAYHTRPWCRWELLTAKRLGRPIVVADLSAGRIERTYPYLGNVPSLCVAASAEGELSDGEVERLTLALLSEALRVELWQQHAAEQLAGRPARLLARPPELVDLVPAAGGAAAGAPDWVVYPDPPLGSEETELLGLAHPQGAVLSLSQARARL
jgi:hypothetical protein